MITSNVVLLIVLLLVIGMFPVWPHSRGWGFYPSSGLGGLLLMLIILRVMGLA